MLKYACKICNKNFRDKCDLNRHTNKKNKCVKQIVSTKNNIIDKISNISNIDTKSIVVTKNKQPHSDSQKCQYCLKTFFDKYCMKKHVKNNCRVKKQIEFEKENIFRKLLEDKEKDTNKKLEEENKYLKKMIKEKDKKFIKLSKDNKKIFNEFKNLAKINNSTTNNKDSFNTTNNTTNNVVNNIIMVDHGKEDLKIIDNKHFVKLIKNTRLVGVNIPNEVLKIIHFNEEYPQLSNIYISDINRHKCMVYENNKWVLSPEDRVPEVVRKIIDYSNDKLDEFGEKHCDNDGIMRRLNIMDKYIKLADNDHLEELIDEEAKKDKIQKCKDFQKKTYDTIKTTLYNKREIAENSMKTI
jgi:hypothetical protein